MILHQTRTEQTYKIDFSFGDPLWQNSYNVLFDLHQSKIKALGDSNTVLAAANMILSAKIFQELVDLYGNLPYSQAFQSATFPTPAYDDAQSIYNDLMASLDSAVDYMGGVSALLSFSKCRYYCTRQPEQWIHFANTLKLRLLIRQSQVAGFDASDEIAKIVSSGGVLADGENIAVNPGYTNDVNKQSPFYADFGYDPTGNKANTSTNANSYILNILSSRGPKDWKIFHNWKRELCGKCLWRPDRFLEQWRQHFLFWTRTY